MSVAKCNLDAEIAVVGAGVAGLVVAQELQREGRSFVLLEASHRIGGRVYSECLDDNIPFDLGAHWIHSDEINPFAGIAEQCGAVLQRESEHYVVGRYFEDSAWLPASASDEFAQYFEQQFVRISEAASATENLSVLDVIDNESRWASYFYLYFGQNFTCDVDLISVQDAAAYRQRGSDLAVASGFGNLITSYGGDLPVSLNTVVAEIDSSGPAVRLTTNRGALRVAKVILTVSTGVLADQQIRFVPSLPDRKLDAVRALPMGSCTRIGLTFEEPILADLPGDFTVRVGDDEPLHFRNRPCGHQCVEITTGGRLAEWMERSGEAATIDHVLARLRKVLGNDVDARVRRRIVSAWDGDAWTRGSYSYAIPGGELQRQRLAEPLDDRIYFAGEATSGDFYATVHGAWFSARDVVSLL